MNMMGICCSFVLGMWALMISPHSPRRSIVFPLPRKVHQGPESKATCSRAHSESLAEEGTSPQSIRLQSYCSSTVSLLSPSIFYCTNNNNGKNKINFHLTTSSKSAVSILPHSLDSFLHVFITALLRYSSHTIKWTLFKLYNSVFFSMCRAVQLSSLSNFRAFHYPRKKLHTH